MVIDDVIVKKRRRCIELDIRIRNPGENVANITRADLDVIERMPALAISKESASYDLLLADDHNSIPVAHVLRSNEVDRFKIRVGSTSFNLSCYFEVQLILHYNQDQSAISEPFSFESHF
jgi:hypothetical protein